MNFISPIWLWSLLGLAIPIGIHLLSRKEGKTVYIGSIRHLLDSNTTRFSSLKLNEILLLLLRVTLITLIAFILAGLMIPFQNQTHRKWLLIEKGIENNQRLNPVIDSLQGMGFETHFLSKGFPIIDDSALVKPVTNYHALLTDLDNKELSQVVILSYTLSSQFKGQRIPLPENYQWINVERTTRNFIHHVAKLKGDSLKVRAGETSEKITAFNTKIVRSSLTSGSVYRTETDTAQIAQLTPITINIFFSPPFEKDATFLIASLDAIATETQLPIIISKEKTSDYTNQQVSFQFWMSDEAIPENFKNGIAFVNCGEQNQSVLLHANHASLFCHQPTGIEWVITKRLTQENILNENFTVALAKILWTKPIERDRSFPDHRMLPPSLAWSKKEREMKISLSGKGSIETYLAILLLLTLVAERWVAFKRNQ